MTTRRVRYAQVALSFEQCEELARWLLTAAGSKLVKPGEQQ